jgi:hypothetical protein
MEKRFFVLSIPLHIMSTTPWSATREFAHPLGPLLASDDFDPEIRNYHSYTMIDESIWHE